MYSARASLSIALTKCGFRATPFRRYKVVHVVTLFSVIRISRLFGSHRLLFIRLIKKEYNEPPSQPAGHQMSDVTKPLTAAAIHSIYSAKKSRRIPQNSIYLEKRTVSHAIRLIVGRRHRIRKWITSSLNAVGDGLCGDVTKVGYGQQPQHRH